MKNHTLIIISVLLGLCLFGCSKSTPKQKIPLQPQQIDLGIVELANNESHTNNFGDGKDCIVTFAASSTNEIQISFVVETKDTDGKIKRVRGPRLITISGE